MPKFPVQFRRKSSVQDDQHGSVGPSFRVLDRSELGPGKSFEGGVRMSKASGGIPRTTLQEISLEDNLFVDMQNTRGSGSSNTTKTTSDNSSRHSNVSTAPSSTDPVAHEDLRLDTTRLAGSAPASVSPAHKFHHGGFLRQAGKTFSFVGNKKHSLPTSHTEESIPPVPDVPDREAPDTPSGPSRTQTVRSSVSTATPPKVDDQDFMLDLGGDFSNMLSAYGKRSSVATLKNESGRPVLASRNLTGNRVNQPSPLHLDKPAVAQPGQRPWTSQNSTEELAEFRKMYSSPANENIPPTMPSPISPTAEVDEDTQLLSDTIAATSMLSPSPANNSSARSYQGDRFSRKADDANMFSGQTRFIPSSVNHVGNQAHNKVMTPAQFEKYRQDKVRQENQDKEFTKSGSDSDEADNYEDEEDDREKSKQLAKQRRKQEAHMTVYRQQMMKVTGEQSNNLASSRLSMMSMSTPNLLLNHGKQASGSNSPPSDGSDEDEEVPLAILAAHGFPGKNRPPTRLSTMGSNPNLRSAMQPSYTTGSMPTEGNAQTSGAGGGSVPAFAKRLPQDPYLGAGLVNQPPRESFALGGGAQTPTRDRAVPVGGLVGVIANEERARALRRGSPSIDNFRNAMPSPTGFMSNRGFDPVAGIPSQMMYPQQAPMSAGDQAQIQMTQQMQQFMQMQMQFMHMMAGQGQGQSQMSMQPQGLPPRPQSHLASQSMGSMGMMPDMQRNSFVGDPMAMGMGMGNGTTLDLPRLDPNMRTMSMVQPSSASWLQPPQAGYAPSIRVVQGNGYAPSIAPSERSNIGLPGRYRPVSGMNQLDTHSRTATMSGALPSLSKLHNEIKVSSLTNDDDDDDEKGWEKMKQKREKRKSMWRTKKSFTSPDMGALIS